jgi:hypothetical protein
MEMAVESMKMALGAIPRPGRVPEQRFLSPKIGLRWRRRCRTFRGWRLVNLGCSPRREYICRRAMSEGGPGPTPPSGAARCGLRHPMVRPPPSPAPSLLWTPSSFQVNRNFGFCFVQFRVYFLCNFSETQK